MTHRLANKVAIVTAATNGIGLSIARRLCAEGANVVISSRQSANVDTALRDLKSMSPRGDLHGLVCHVAKKEDRLKLISETVSKFGKIDILVSNAGTNPHFGPALDIEEDVWDKMFETNVKSAFFLTKEIQPHLNKKASIVYVSSIAGYQPLSLIGSYSITKTTLLGVVKVLAAELGPSGIRVNGIAPGIIQTKFSKALTENETLSDQTIQATALKRLGEPDDCAGTVAYLCSDDSSYVTGEVICITGGLPSRL